MDEFNDPKCSHTTDSYGQQPSTHQPKPQEQQSQEEFTSSESLYEPRPRSFTFSSTSTNTLFTFDPKYKTFPATLPLVIKSSNDISEQPELRLRPSVTSNSISGTNIEPQSLFEQALSKLGNQPIDCNQLRLASYNQSLTNMFGLPSGVLEAGEETPPNSLENAPPSYSFVLRQMAAPKRPRFMGTFVPSPSFVQQTPPPTYATTFDIYIDAAPPIRRVYTFGYTPMPVICPECGFGGITLTRNKIIPCTHICALVLCLLCCWVCAPLPYFLASCQEVYHYCRNCRHFLGMYSPSDPERPSVQIHNRRVVTE